MRYIRSLYTISSFSNSLNFFPVSTFTKGEQMIPVLNKIGTHCAVFGNHDFGKFEWFNLKIFAFAIICSGRMKGILKSSSKSITIIFLYYPSQCAGGIELLQQQRQKLNKLCVLCHKSIKSLCHLFRTNILLTV